MSDELLTSLYNYSQYVYITRPMLTELCASVSRLCVGPAASRPNIEKAAAACNINTYRVRHFSERDAMKIAVMFMTRGDELRVETSSQYLRLREYPGWGAIRFNTMSETRQSLDATTIRKVTAGRPTVARVALNRVLCAIFGVTADTLIPPHSHQQALHITTVVFNHPDMYQPYAIELAFQLHGGDSHSTDAWALRDLGLDVQKVHTMAAIDLARRGLMVRYALASELRDVVDTAFDHLITTDYAARMAALGVCDAA
jgi:hypothetical protein